MLTVLQPVTMKQNKAINVENVSVASAMVREKVPAKSRSSGVVGTMKQVKLNFEKEKPRVVEEQKKVEERTVSEEAGSYFKEIVENAGKDYDERNFARLKGELEKEVNKEAPKLLNKKRQPEYRVEIQKREEEYEEELDYDAEKLPQGKRVNLNEDN